MNAYEKVIGAVETVASNPKVALGVSSVTGGISLYDYFKEGLSVSTMLVALLTGLVVLAYQLMKTYRMWRAMTRDLPEPKDE